MVQDLSSCTEQRRVNPQPNYPQLRIARKEKVGKGKSIISDDGSVTEHMKLEIQVSKSGSSLFDVSPALHEAKYLNILEVSQQLRHETLAKSCFYSHHHGRIQSTATHPPSTACHLS